MGHQRRDRLAVCDAQPQVAQCVDSAATQHVGRTASMMVSINQRSAAEPFTARPAFRDYGSCGQYGGVDSIAVEAA